MQCCNSGKTISLERAEFPFYKRARPITECNLKSRNFTQIIKPSNVSHHFEIIFIVYVDAIWDEIYFGLIQEVKFVF